MANKYYDKKYEDHILFFDEPEWLTPWEWIEKYPGIMGAYDTNLVKTEITDNTKLPFVYSCKHKHGDDLAMYKKLMNDDTQYFGSRDDEVLVV